MSSVGWSSCAAQVGTFGNITLDTLKELTDSLSQDEFLHFATADHALMLEFIQTVQDELRANVNNFLDVGKSDKFRLLMGLIYFSLKLISTLEGSLYYNVVAGPLLPPIAEFIELHLKESRLLQGKVDKLWFRVIDGFQMVAKEASLRLPNLSSFLQTCLDLAVTPTSDWRLQRQGVLMLVAFFRNKKTHPVIAQLILSQICSMEKKKKHHKKMWKSDKKISPLLELLISLVQHGLASSKNETVSYEVTFAFAANFIDTLVNKCEKQEPKTEVILPQLECWIKDLLHLLSSPLWPGARLLFHLVIKKLASGFSKPTNFKLPVIFVRQLPDIISKIKELDSGLEELCANIKSEKPEKKVEKMLRMSFAKFCEENSDEIVGDLKKMYNVLWGRKEGPISFADTTAFSSYILSGKEASYAAHHFDSYKKTSDVFLKYIISACLSIRKDVKTTAINSISKVVLADPKMLLLDKINVFFLSCIESATVYSKETSALVLKSFLKMYPEKLSDYSKHLMLLLDDVAHRVRFSTIQIISEIFTGPPIAAASNYLELFYKIMTFAEDEDVQLAVVKFFNVIWLENDQYLEILINIARRPNLLRCVGVVLSSVCSQQRNLCQSQPAKLEKEEIVDDEVRINLVRLTSSLLDMIPSHASEASALLLTLAKTCPSCTQPYMDVFMHQMVETNSVRLKYIFVEILRELLPLCSKKEVEEIVQKVHQELQKDESLDWDVVTTISFLKIVRNMREEEIHELYYSPSKRILTATTASDEQTKKEAKRALCVVGFLCRDRDKHADLLVAFLKNPSFNLTLLSVECQLRLEFIPPSGNAFLEKEVARILRSKEDTDLTNVALYVIHCTLRGYKNNIETANLRQLGQTTTEVVSNFIQSTLNDVLACTLDKRQILRTSASSVVNLIVESGLVLMPKLLPHIIAMTVDSHIPIRKLACTLLNRASENWDITLFVLQGIDLARTLKSSSENILARGFDGEKFTADFSAVYETVQSSAIKRRKLIGSILTETFHANELSKALYLTDQITYFPYKLSDEALYTATEISKLLPFGGDKNKFLLLILKRAKWFLCHTFKISDSKIRDYFPSNKASTETLKRHTKMADYIPKHLLEKVIRGIFDRKELDSDVSDAEDINTSVSSSVREFVAADSDEEDNIPLSVLAQRLRKLPDSSIHCSSDIQSLSSETAGKEKNKNRESTLIVEADTGRKIPIKMKVLKVKLKKLDVRVVPYIVRRSSKLSLRN